MKPSIHATKVSQHARRLNLSFDVREDMPSERMLEYRALVIRGLEVLRCDHDTTADEHEMIDRVLWDHIDEPELVTLLEIKRTLVRCIDGLKSVDCSDVIVELEAIDTQISDRLKASNIE